MIAFALLFQDISLHQIFPCDGKNKILIWTKFNFSSQNRDVYQGIYHICIISLEN